MVTIDLSGKHAVVMGVANHRSLSWAIAQQLHHAGAALCLTYAGERLRPAVEELASRLPGTLTFDCDVTQDRTIAGAYHRLAFGIEGYQVCLGWAVQVSNYLRRRLAAMPCVGILNPDEGGLSTVFRVYPPGADGKAELKRELTDPGYRAKLEENNRFSQALFKARDKELTVWDAKLDYTSAGTWARYDHETPIPGWKAYILNPRVQFQDVDRFIEGLARRHANAGPA